MDQFDPAIVNEVEERMRHEQIVDHIVAASEPASPPDYGNAFPNAFSKPNRYSNASLTSPPGIINRPSRSGTQLTSPTSGFVRPYTAGNAHLPSHSVPGSRRQSDDEEEDDAFLFGLDTSIHRAAANPNRNSMPITGYDRKRNTADLSSLGPVNTTSFLFDDDEDHPLVHSKSNTTSPPNKPHRLSLQVGQTADGFPKLIRADQSNNDISPSAALDLAFVRGVEPQPQLTDRATGSRHRISLPPTALSSNGNIAPLNSILANADNKSSAPNRRSLEVKFSAETKRPSLVASPPRGMTNGSMQKPMTMSSYSTNDIPTLRSINGDSTGGISVAPPSKQIGNATDSSEHSGDLNRVTSASNNTNRQSQDFASMGKTEEINGHNLASHQSILHPNAVPFGPLGGNQENSMPGIGQNGMPPYVPPNYFGNAYNVPIHMLSNGFSAMTLNGGYNGQSQWQPQPNMFGQQGNYGNYGQYNHTGQASAGAGRYGDNHRSNMNQRRQMQEEAFAKYNSISIEDLVGEFYGLCKDQHGCRFLQRKLDERNERITKLIFDEVKDHIIELMTDPFGNYLCQKLLENTDDAQRTVLIQNAMPAMTKIALNQHGTRALQKMIEFISTAEQIQMIIQALRYDVVQLIQDLNGNHVIQKCLNHLSPQDAQFIFDAVGANCVAVGTHRHGCCVLQRCIDHATGMQKSALVDQVIKHAFSLVQDPFGNYVVQYILDLSEPAFTEPLCRNFYGNVAFLSKQKFSSNVVEKCIRRSSEETKRGLVQEIMDPQELDKLLRDSFANYVVQTAMEFADEESKAVLMENIRPILPSIRHTPYGRRIQTKMTDYDNRNAGVPSNMQAGVQSNAKSNTTSGVPSGITTPAETISPPNGTSNVNLPFGAQSAPTGRGNRNGFIAAQGPPPSWTGNGTLANPTFSTLNGYTGNLNGSSGEIASPSPQRHTQNHSWFSSEGPGLNNFGNSGMNGQPPHFGGRF
ncbi:hypothetical protein M433DRAFT_391803 [Acidomyces richmondensis BFW]|nr:MAG: hypothetical protein FE78DRAFT_226090 [Acidomyces sp. 'richmondensis']KYG48728.1 hypothetical protein M433DRAFT_391803 [Acidomyces richmondensis BFW]